MRKTEKKQRSSVYQAHRRSSAVSRARRAERSRKRVCGLWRKRLLVVAVELYKANKCDKLLMSGDNRFRNYNEPERMRDYAVREGVPVEDIVLDYAGRRTYDSVYRARHIFGTRKMIIVTQSFHVDRAVFLAGKVGIDAYGVASSNKADTRAAIRECPACLSALADVYLLHPRPVMGEKESI